MTNVFLYHGEASPNNVVLADPTAARSGSPTTHTYAGTIAAQSTVPATYSKTKRPVVLIAAQSTITSLLKKIKRSLTSIAAVSTLTSLLKKTKVDPVSITAGQTTVSSVTSFVPGGAHAYAGKIDCTSGVSGAPRFIDNRPRAWRDVAVDSYPHRVEAPARIFVHRGQISATSPRLESVHSRIVAFTGQVTVPKHVLASAAHFEDWMDFVRADDEEILALIA